MGNHAKFAPSAAHRNMACPGAIWLSSKCPEGKSSVYAEEGTRAHEHCKDLLLAVLADKEDFLSALAQREAAMDNDEMRMHVAAYVQMILGLCAQHKPYRVAIEREFVLDEELDIWGTADFVLAYNDEERGACGILVDLKYGQGVPVSADGNWQMRVYGAAIAEEWDLKEMTTVIYQPRVENGTSSASYNRAELKLIKKEVLIAARKSFQVLADDGKGAEFLSGEHCRWCPAAAICETHNKRLSIAAAADFAPKMDNQAFAPPDIHALTQRQIVKIVLAEDEISSYLKRVCEYAMSRLEAGDTLPGLKLVEGRMPPRRWVDNEALIVEGLTALGVAPFEEKLRTITSVEKEIGKRPELDKYTKRGKRPRTIVAHDDPRPAIEVAKEAAEEFESVDEDKK